MHSPDFKQIIAVIDDDPDLRSMLCDFLEGSGFGVIPCANPNHFLEASRDLLNEVSAIVSDINMPEMNGIDFLKKIKAQRENLPFILISAVPDQAYEPNTNNSTVFLKKPFLLKEFLQQLTLLLPPQPRPVRKALAPGA